MVTIREVLNKLKWTGAAGGDFEVTYVSRGGAPNDEVTIQRRRYWSYCMMVSWWRWREAGPTYPTTGWC